MVQISAIKFMPSAPRSSNLPTKGDINAAPALAARRACAAEKHSVTLTIIPLSESSRHKISPSVVKGTFIVTFLPSPDSTFASSRMPLNSIAVTSALTGPSTSAQISAIVCFMSRPDFAIRDGLVVTPSTIPVGRRAFISSQFAVSRKIFILSLIKSYCLFAGIISLDKQGRPLDHLHTAGVQCTVFRVSMAM